MATAAYRMKGLLGRMVPEGQESVLCQGSETGAGMAAGKRLSKHILVHSREQRINSR